MTKKCPVGFDPREVLTIVNEHHQKHDSVQGQVMYLRIVVSEEISNETVDGHHESMVKEVDEDHSLTGVKGGHILAKGTPIA